MSNQLKHILDSTKDKSIDFTKYKSYYISEYLDMNDPNIINILKEYLDDSLIDIKIYYNSKTKTFNSVGILDLDDYRVVDLDDDNWTMTNKGIDIQVELKIE